jgi:hypothetical protein
MKVNLHAALATLIALAGIVGCGSYSSPSPPTAADSTSDSTPKPPAYLYR